MAVKRDAGLQFALIKESLDPEAQKRQVEEKIRAVEERNNLLLENAARMDIRSYMQERSPDGDYDDPNRSVSQLSLSFDNDAVSALRSVLTR
jgi:hypothetical protein